jgi:hypothetical protein
MMESELATQLISVSPSGGAIAVPPGSNIVLSFDRAMMAGMEQYVALHAGGVTGPSIPITCAWSNGQQTLTCQPGQPLTAATRHTIHLGGGMMSADGRPVDMERYGMGMRGQWATGGMMGNQTGMMGSGWMHANGSYGMVFEFTTQ